MSIAATPSSSAALIAENEPAQMTTTAINDRCARAIESGNARRRRIVRSERGGRASDRFQPHGTRYFSRARDPARLPRRLDRRHLHAGPGHRPDDPEHARRRAAGRNRDRGRRRARPGALDARRERRRRRAAERVRAGVSRAQARRSGVPRLPRRAVDPRRDPAAGARPRPREAAARRRLARSGRAS